MSQFVVPVTTTTIIVIIITTNASLAVLASLAITPCVNSI